MQIWCPGLEEGEGSQARGQGQGLAGLQWQGVRCRELRTSCEVPDWTKGPLGTRQEGESLLTAGRGDGQGVSACAEVGRGRATPGFLPCK